MSGRSYYELEVWHKSMDFVVACYKASASFPSHELYGLSSQLRRAAVSIPSNIAEGQGRIHTREFIRHLSIAHGSLMETETQLRIALRLGYIAPPTDNAPGVKRAYRTNAQWIDTEPFRKARLIFFFNLTPSFALFCSLLLSFFSQSHGHHHIPEIVAAIHRGSELRL